METLNPTQWRDIKPSIWQTACTNVDELLPIHLDWFMLPLGSDPSDFVDMNNSELFDIRPFEDAIEDAFVDKADELASSADAELAASLEMMDLCGGLPPGLQATPSRPPGLNPQSVQFFGTICYPEGCWSPNNPQGSRIYPINFMMQFKDIGLNVDLRSKVSDQSILRGVAMDSPFKQNFFRDNKKVGTGIMSKKSKSGRIYSNQPFTNPWASNTPQPDDNLSCERFYRSILNMMTPKNFEKLLVQIREKRIASHERLMILVNILIEKATLDVNYVKLYTDLAVQLDSSLNYDYKVEEGKSFRLCMIDGLKTRFDQRYDKEVVIPPNVTPLERMELENLKNKINSAIVGLMRFIGELSGIRFLEYSFVKYVIDNLIYDNGTTRHAQNIEQFFSFVVAAGYGLSVNYPSFNGEINAHLNQVRQIIARVSIPSRIKFLLQDVEDLRRENWIKVGDYGGLLSTPLPSVMQRPQNQQPNRVYSSKNVDSGSTQGVAGGRLKSHSVQHASKPAQNVVIHNKFQSLQSEDFLAEQPQPVVVEAQEVDDLQDKEFSRIIDKFEKSKSSAKLIKYLETVKDAMLPAKISYLLFEFSSMSKDHMFIAFRDLLSSKLKSHVVDGILHALNSDADLYDYFDNPANQLMDLVLLCFKEGALNDHKLRRLLEKIPLKPDEDRNTFFCEKVRQKCSEAEFNRFFKCFKMT